MKIFVSNIKFRFNENDLRELFEGHGKVDSCKVVMDKHTGRSRGFGFVEMFNDNEAKGAIDALNGYEIDGRALVVKESTPKARQ